jgi:hypothetical protein
MSPKPNIKSQITEYSQMKCWFQIKNVFVTQGILYTVQKMPWLPVHLLLISMSELLPDFDDILYLKPLQKLCKEYEFWHYFFTKYY